VATPHKLNISADPKTSLEAAAASAAHDVLVALYPDRAIDFSPLLAASLARISNDVTKPWGYALGKNAAKAILGLRLSTEKKGDDACLGSNRVGSGLSAIGPLYPDRWRSSSFSPAPLPPRACARRPEVAPSLRSADFTKGEQVGSIGQRSNVRRRHGESL
jgi:hypothetical protein